MLPTAYARSNAIHAMTLETKPRPHFSCVGLRKRWLCTNATYLRRSHAIVHWPEAAYKLGWAVVWQAFENDRPFESFSAHCGAYSSVWSKSAVSRVGMCAASVTSRFLCFRKRKIRPLAIRHTPLIIRFKKSTFVVQRHVICLRVSYTVVWVITTFSDVPDTSTEIYSLMSASQMYFS